MVVGFGGEIVVRDVTGPVVREDAVFSRPVGRGRVPVVIAAAVLPLRPCAGRGIEPSRACDALDGKESAPVESDTLRLPTVGSDGCGRRGEGASTAASRVVLAIRDVADVNVVWLVGLVGLGTGLRGLANADDRTFELGACISCFKGDDLGAFPLTGEVGGRPVLSCDAFRIGAGVCLIGDWRNLLLLGRKSGGRKGSLPIMLLPLDQLGPSTCGCDDGTGSVLIELESRSIE